MSRITRRNVIPVNQITPLTYRDGVTYIQMLTELSDYIKTILHPSLQHTVDQIVADVEHQMDKHHDQYVEGVQEFQRIHDAFMSDVNARLIALNDGAVSDLLADETSLLRQSLHNHFVSHGETNQRVIVATNPKYGEPYTKASVLNALDDAERLGRNTIVYFPTGIYNVDTGLSLNGYSAQLRGDGAVGSQSDRQGTIFYAPNQNGPVLDFRGWVFPDHFTGKAIHEGFRVVGSGESDPSKQNTGLTFGDLSSTVFRDIAIEDTGGPGLYGSENRPGGAVYICDFERIVVKTPIDARVNDIPYYHFIGANGNRFRGIGMRSLTKDNSCGVSGAVLLEHGTTYAPHSNHFDTPWIEYMQVPPGGTMFHIRGGTSNVLSNLYIVDHSFMSNTGNASLVKFSRGVSATGNNLGAGGNILTGFIPGAVTLQSENYGVIVEQPNNRMSGTKGYPGRNVYLAEGVEATSIELGGSVASSVKPGVIDESGNNTNTIVDPSTGTYHYGHHRGAGHTDHALRYGDVTVSGTPHRETGVSGSRDLDTTTTNTFMLQLTGQLNITDIIGGVGTEVTIILQQGSGAPHTVTWPDSVRFTNNEPPELTSNNGWFDAISFKLVDVIGGNRWVETSRSLGMRHNS